ncbi:hypothetical protein SD71_00315 [Cohnella kolymensis]|uniref:Uncharacterized protein n=2 Tax=Cohnella kolymensis TaxID=1590652 RepID=A0ABR5A9Q6_9BACL|nr:hypothetical protein SD71_00315 [Cohnella kolymensis]
MSKHLKSMSQEQLIELVKECFDASKDMERFLAVRIMGKEAVLSLFHEYRKKVEHEFFPQRGHGKLRLAEAKKAISDFEKLTGNARYSLELKLIYVEMGVAFTVAYGDIDQRFYSSIESVYADVIGTVIADDSGELLHEYKNRIHAVVSDSQGIGWGFHDNLSDLYNDLS